MIPVESRVLVESHSMLVAGLEGVVGSMSVKCYSKSLISEDTHKDILELNLPNREKVTRVLLNVQQTIKQKQEMFEEFVNMLDELTCCNHLIEELRRKKELFLKVSCGIFAEPCVILWQVLMCVRDTCAFQAL